MPIKSNYYFRYAVNLRILNALWQPGDGGQEKLTYQHLANETGIPKERITAAFSGRVSERYFKGFEALAEFFQVPESFIVNEDLRSYFKKEIDNAIKNEIQGDSNVFGSATGKGKVMITTGGDGKALREIIEAKDDQIRMLQKVVGMLEEENNRLKGE